jgi:A/G-specific adenine glycosylase
LPADWQDCGEVRHTFTHFRLVLTVWSAAAGAATFPGAFWAGPDETGGMPTVFRKALALAKG